MEAVDPEVGLGAEVLVAELQSAVHRPAVSA